MKSLCRFLVVFGLAMSIGSAVVSADDSVVYDFDGWKVTITPGHSSAKAPRPLPVETADPVAPRTEANATLNGHRTAVQQVSLQETESTSETGKASSTTSPTADLAQVPFVLPPSPPSENAVASDSVDSLPLITPRSPDKAAYPSSAVMPIQTALYRDIYFSIPFNRAEYNAYPSYRHDATMELLFNQMRNTIIQRGTTNVYQYDMHSGYSPYTPYYPFTYGLRIHSSR